MKIQRKKFDASIPVASMADIAFLLLIFFIVLAKNTSESTVEWEPANVISISPADASICSVIIDKKQNIYVNGQWVGLGEVKTRIAELLGERPRGQRKVLLKVDKNIEARIFEQVIFDISESGGEVFRILDAKPQPLAGA